MYKWIEAISAYVNDDMVVYRNDYGTYTNIVHFDDNASIIFIDGRLVCSDCGRSAKEIRYIFKVGDNAKNRVLLY